MELAPLETFAEAMWGPKKEQAISEGPPLVDPSMTAQQEQAAADSVSQTMAPQQINSPSVTKPVIATTSSVQPSGMTPAQETVTRVSVDPKLVKNQERILGTMQAAEQSRVDAEVAQNSAVSAELKSRAAMQLANAQETERINAEREKVAAQKVADVNKAVQNFNANSKINPNRYMENMGTGGRVLAAIAGAFGAFGSAITHSPNYAQQMIDRAIDADIKAQEHEVSALGQKVNFAQNQYASFRNQGLDADAARVATRQLKLQQSMSKIDEILANTNNDVLKAKGAQIKAGLENSANKDLMQYGHTQRSTVNVNPAAGGGGTQLPANEAEKLGTANAAIDEAKKLYSEWDSSARGVIGFVKSLLPMNASSRYENSRAIAKQIIGAYLEGGVLRKEDEEKYNKFLPSAGESLETGLNKRDKLIAAIATRAEEQRKALGRAGFNVGEIKINKPISTFKPIE